MNYWLMKSEPEVYSIWDLKKDRITIWDGVRNYQARNFLRQMRSQDQVFLYHSNTKPPGIVGMMSVVESGIDDPTQFDSQSAYYDCKSTIESPRWQTVKVQFEQEFSNLITLDRLKQEFGDREFLLVRKGNRLSVMPVLEEIADRILSIASDTTK